MTQIIVENNAMKGIAYQKKIRLIKTIKFAIIFGYNNMLLENPFSILFVNKKIWILKAKIIIDIHKRFLFLAVYRHRYSFASKHCIEWI